MAQITLRSLLLRLPRPRTPDRGSPCWPDNVDDGWPRDNTMTRKLWVPIAAQAGASPPDLASYRPRCGDSVKPYRGPSAPPALEATQEPEEIDWNHFLMHTQTHTETHTHGAVGTGRTTAGSLSGTKYQGNDLRRVLMVASAARGGKITGHVCWMSSPIWANGHQRFGNGHTNWW